MMLKRKTVSKCLDIVAYLAFMYAFATEGYLVGMLIAQVWIGNKLLILTEQQAEHYRLTETLVKYIVSPIKPTAQENRKKKVLPRGERLADSFEAPKEF